MRKVLTIKAGESKILPKGAKIIKTATTGLTVTSTCPNVQEQLLNHEYYSCYSFSIGSSASGGRNGLYIFGETMTFTGISVGGTNHQFLNPLKFNGANVSTSSAVERFRQLLETIQGEILKLEDLKGVFLNSCVNVASIDHQNRGVLGYISFRSLPSLAEQSSIYLIGQYEGSEGNFTPVSIPALPISSFTGSVKPCPCTQ